MNCPNCSEPLSERGCFCRSCGSQARCRQCREVLESGAVACVECGTRLVEGSSGPIPQSVDGLSAQRNTISYQEDRNSKTFSASLTDNAIQHLGNALTELSDFLRGNSKPAQVRHIPQRDREVIEHPKELSLPAAGEESVPPSPQSDGARVLNIFRANGSMLDLIDNRLKAKNGSDYLRRLTYLFLYAHELHGRSSTPKTELIAVLKEGKIWDSNASTWLKKKKGFKVDGDDRVELIGAGRDEAKKALNDALDSNVADEWNPDTKTVKQRTQRKKP